jgi:hypothetical protein
MIFPMNAKQQNPFAIGQLYVGQTVAISSFDVETMSQLPVGVTWVEMREQAQVGWKVVQSQSATALMPEAELFAARQCTGSLVLAYFPPRAERVGDRAIIAVLLRLVD